MNKKKAGMILEGGGTMTVPFDISAPAGTHATDRRAPATRWITCPASRAA